MLKIIDPLLNADVLYALRAMGHGDELILCDANFPADSVARQTVLGRLLRIDGTGVARAARAILSVFPLDTFVDEAALRMEVVGSPDEVPPVQVEVQREIDRAEGKPRPLGSIERFAFYEAVQAGLLRGSDRRVQVLRLLRVQKGCHPPDLSGAAQTAARALAISDCR
jgi:L-fucose mutarotase